MKKRSALKGCLISILAFIAIGILVAIIATSIDTEDVEKLELSMKGDVAYIIEGTAAKASVTYVNDLGGMEQIAEVTLPYEKNVTVNYGTPLSIVAQNLSDSGTITCKIIIDGKEVKSATSEGGYVVVSCADVVMPKP